MDRPKVRVMAGEKELQDYVGELWKYCDHTEQRIKELEEAAVTACDLIHEGYDKAAYSELEKVLPLESK